MNKHLSLIALLMVLALVSTGCGAASVAQQQSPLATVQRFSPTEWPTPQPTAVTPTPSPFPIVTLPPTPTRRPIPGVDAPLSTEAAAAPTPAGGRLVFSGDVNALVSQVTALSGGFAPAAAARVVTDSATVRQTPAASAAPVGEAKQGDMVAVLGKNQDGAWLYVLTASLVQGWLPANTLQTIVPLRQAPVLPDNPLAQKPTPDAVTSALQNLSPAAAFMTIADNVSLRQGPGANYPAVSVEAKGELGGVLGKNAAGDWLYVITINGNLGWLPADSVRLMGSMADLKVLPANPVAAARPAAPAAAQPTPAPQVADLPVVASAQVDAAMLNMRQGPGAGYPVLGTLKRGDNVSILAVNRAQDWALIRAADGMLAWVSLAYLNVSGSLANAPQMSSPLPESGVLGGQPPQGGQVTPSLPPAASSPAATATPAPTEAPAPAATATPAPTEAPLPAATAAPAPTEAPAPAATAAPMPTEAPPPEPTATPEPGLTLPAITAIPRPAYQAEATPLPATPLPTAVFDAIHPASADPAGPGQVAPVSYDPPPIIADPKLDPQLLYKGPASTFEPIVKLRGGDTVSILGVNAQRDWALVKTIGNTYKAPGWMPLAELTIRQGSPDSAPSLITGWVNSNQVTMYCGPAIFYPAAGPAAIDTMVAVLGVDQSRTWALITPVLSSNLRAWIPFQFVTLSGAWLDVPEAQVAACPAAIPTPGGAPAVAQPTRPPVGRLVFQLSSGGDIMVINVDGSGLRRLTTGMDPVLSPDGQTVAYTRWDLGQMGALWTINVDGSNERALVGEMHWPKGPDWSPDGTRIVMNFQRGGFLDPQKKCFKVDVNEKGEQPNIPSNAYDIHTEPHKGIPYICWMIPADAHWTLRVVNAASGSFEDLYGGTYAFRPAWDPIQPWRVVADSGYGLLQTDVTDVTQTHSQGITNQSGDGSPVISPDGRHIAVVNNASNIYDIFRLNADGSGRARLTATPLWVTVQPGQAMWNNVAPAWSPDSSQIAFLTDRSGRWEIWVMNADGWNPHAMFPEAINNQLHFKYDFNDERVISWR